MPVIKDNCTRLLILLTSILCSVELGKAQTPIKPKGPNTDRILSSSASGFIESHSGFSERNYERNIDSSLTISGLVRDQKVTIVFSHFSLYHYGGNRGCVKDFFEISGLMSGKRRFCSDSDSDMPDINSQITLTSAGYYIKFKFVTNNILSTGQDGFRFRYKVGTAPTTAPPTATTMLLNSTTLTKDAYASMLAQKIGIGVGTTIAVLVIIAVVIVILIKQRKNNARRQQASSDLQRSDDRSKMAQSSAQKDNAYSSVPVAAAGGPRNFYGQTEEYQLADEVIGEQYNNSSDQQRATENGSVSEAYDVVNVTSHNHGRPTIGVKELVENDLYGT